MCLLVQRVEKLQQIIEQYNFLMQQISTPEIISNTKKYTKLAREEKHLSIIIPKAKEYIKTYKQYQEDEEILQGDDNELKEIVKEEIVELKNNLDNMENELKILLLPRDPKDDRNTIIEIRSGTGGNEAALFANSKAYSKLIPSEIPVAKAPLNTSPAPTVSITLSFILNDGK